MKLSCRVEHAQLDDRAGGRGLVGTFPAGAHRDHGQSGELQVTTRGPLHNRSFQVYLLGNTISGLGTWSQRIGIGWLSWELTHSASWVGAISLAQLLPLIVFGPLFGALLDRNDYRRYALSANIVLAVLALALYVLVVLHAMRIELLCAMAVLLGIANSAYQAVRLTMVNSIVSREQLSPAIALASVLFNVTRAVGPAMAGAIIANFGIAAAFACNAVSFIGMLVALLIVRLRPRTTTRPTHGVVADSIEGLRYVVGHAGLRQLLLLSAVTGILGRGIIELMPAYADVVFRKGSVGLAHLATAAGIGAIAGALVLSRVHAGRRLVQLTSSATLAVGAMVCIFGLCTSFMAGLLVAAVLGFTVVLCSVGLQVRLQICVSDSYRGRVVGVWSAVNIAGPGLGAAMTGALAQQLGLKVAALAAGTLCVALVTLVTLSSQPTPAAAGH